MRKLLLFWFVIICVANCLGQSYNYYTSLNSAQAPLTPGLTLTLAIGTVIFIKDIPPPVDGMLSVNVIEASPVTSASCRYVGNAVSTFSLAVNTSSCSVDGLSRYLFSAAQGGIMMFQTKVMSASVGLNENAVHPVNLSIYPNPTLNEIIVELPETQVYDIKISNILGVVCREVLQADTKEKINLVNQIPGVYFLKIYEKGHLTGTYKLIKE